MLRKISKLSSYVNKNPRKFPGIHILKINQTNYSSAILNEKSVNIIRYSFLVGL
jgi:hypothetical protein